MQENQELGRRSSKIRKKMFLEPDKTFWKIYSSCSKGVNIKHSKWNKEVHKIYSERGFKKFYSGMQEIQELGRRISKIGKKKFLDSDKRFWMIYSWFPKGVNTKHLKWD